MANHKTVLLVLCLLALGLILRIYRPGQYSFGFDQVQILEAATHIRSGNLTLIGPRTGPAAMFTGPLVYYLTAVLSYVVPSPWTVVALALSLYVTTFLVLAVLLWRYVEDTSQRVVFLALYALSPFQVFLDRIPWNPNVMILASALVLFPLLRQKNTVTWREVGLIALGTCLGYQAHFAGLLLPLFVVLAMVCGRVGWKGLLGAMGGLGVSLLPTAYFDFRHEWLNLKGLMTLVTQQQAYSGNVPIYIRMLDDVARGLENLGRILTVHPPQSLSVIIGLVVLVLFWRLSNKSGALFRVIGIWLLGVLLTFPFYRGEKPEYYFLIQFPALYLILSLVVVRLIRTQSSRVFAVFGFGSFAFFVVWQALQVTTPMSIANELALSRYVAARLLPGKAPVYDMVDVEATGIKYLYQAQGGKAVNQSASVHIVYPYQEGPFTQQFSSLAVWVDPRVDETKNYIIEGNQVLSTSGGMKLLKDNYPQQVMDTARAVYALVQDGRVLGAVYLIPEQLNQEAFRNFRKRLAPDLSGYEDVWHPVKYLDKAYYLQQFDRLFIMVSLNSPATVNQDLQLVRHLEVI